MTGPERLVHPEPAVTDITGAAAYLATTVRHIRTLTDTRQLTFHKVGGKLRFRITDLERYLKTHRTEAVG